MNKLANTPPILDACCGGRMCHFNKENPQVLFGDIRTENLTLCDGRKFNVTPDIKLDFRDLPFADKSFSLVLFDPPHLTRAGENSWLALKYGKLNETWQEDIRQGFAECWRVLKPNGTLVFKWNETQIKLAQLRPLFPASPVFGHTTTQNLATHWMTFFKADEQGNTNE